MHEKINISKNFVVALVALALVTSIIWAIWIRNWNRQFKDFKKIKLSTEFRGQFQLLHSYKGYSYVQLHDGRQFVIGPLYNKRYNPYHFNELVTGGDSLIKIANSDTLYLVKSRMRYSFQIYYLRK
jgi:hypothetical protein